MPDFNYIRFQSFFFLYTKDPGGMLNIRQSFKFSLKDLTKALEFLKSIILCAVLLKFGVILPHIKSHK